MASSLNNDGMDGMGGLDLTTTFPSTTHLHIPQAWNFMGFTGLRNRSGKQASDMNTENDDEEEGQEQQAAAPPSASDDKKDMIYTDNLFGNTMLVHIAFFVFNALGGAAAFAAVKVVTTLVTNVKVWRTVVFSNGAIDWLVRTPVTTPLYIGYAYGVVFFLRMLFSLMVIWHAWGGVRKGAKARQYTMGATLLNYVPQLGDGIHFMRRWMDSVQIAVIVPSVFYVWGEQDLCSLLAIAASFNLVIGFMGSIEEQYVYTSNGGDEKFAARYNNLMAWVHFLAAFFILSTYWTSAPLVLPANNGGDLWATHGLFVLTVAFATLSVAFRPFTDKWGWKFSPLMNEILANGWMFAVTAVCFGCFMHFAQFGGYSQVSALYGNLA